MTAIKILRRSDCKVIYSNKNGKKWRFANILVEIVYQIYLAIGNFIKYSQTLLT